jgi:hypothetical protein
VDGNLIVAGSPLFGLPLAPADYVSPKNADITDGDLRLAN